VQLARERFVILAVALRDLTIRFHFSGEISEGGLGLRAMLAVLVPVVRPESEKNAGSDQRDFKEEVEERSSIFSAAQAHARSMSGRADGSSFRGKTVTCDELGRTRRPCPQHVTCHMSHVTCHWSLVTRHSPIMPFPFVNLRDLRVRSFRTFL
jgi:hypothetical protein